MTQYLISEGVCVCVTQYLVSEHGRQEGHHNAVLARKLEAEGADGLHHHNLELVGDLRHEGGDLLHEAVHARLAASLSCMYRNTQASVHISAAEITIYTQYHGTCQ